MRTATFLIILGNVSWEMLLISLLILSFNWSSVQGLVDPLDNFIRKNLAE